MKCQECGEEAKVHLTKIKHGKMQKLHLCQACSEKQELIKNQELNLSLILQSVLGQQVGQPTEELSRLTCPTCGIKYMEFKAGGRLGCPQDYKVFQAALEPLLERIHRSRRHVGKVPPHASADAERQRLLIDLRVRLTRAVDEEAYEEAARLRDQLRELTMSEPDIAPNAAAEPEAPLEGSLG
jgi:protein arginine kinase activator